MLLFVNLIIKNIFICIYDIIFFKNFIIRKIWINNSIKIIQFNIIYEFMIK